MHYATIIDGLEREVEIVEVKPGRYHIEMDGKRFDLDARSITETSLSMLLDNDAYMIEFEDKDEGGMNLLLRGREVQAEVLDLRQMRLRKARVESGVADGPAVISSPMPGKVVAVLVKEGESVEEGQGLVVVEAMKMENELKAPKAGVVNKLTAETGLPVDGGASLCVVE